MGNSLLASIGPLDIAVAGIGVIGAGLFMLVGLVSVLEKEARAARRAFALALVVPLPFLLVALLRFPCQVYCAWGLLALTAIAVLALLLPVGRPAKRDPDTPGARSDERDNVFARSALAPGSEAFNEYYATHADKKPLDDRIRAAPGYHSPNARFYDPVWVASDRASFAAACALRSISSGPVAKRKVDVVPEQVTNYVKRWCRHLGAHSVGVTLLQDYHLYSHYGFGYSDGTPVEWGKAIERDHKYAIALAVEMDRAMIRCAPLGPADMESSRQYLAAGAIAVSLALLVRGLGYPARAHLLGSYQVLCPLVARDAGLGEIGRMGLLMTPELGPRVRLAVVTTDLPLVPDKPCQDNAMLDFCAHCTKCAEACPVGAIPFGDRQEHNGVRRWKVNAEACFECWNTEGTYCARCVAVCPFSHPDNFLHRLGRRFVRHSCLARRLARLLEDFLYGRIPAPAHPPEWMSVKEKE